MTNETQSYVQKIIEANKELVNNTLDRTQEAAEKTVDYNRDIWLAGLGVFADARNEGKQAFEKMVTRGEEFETTARKTVDEKTVSIKETINEAFDKAAKPNLPTISVSIDDIFDTRITRAIKRLGTPTASALDSITEQLAEISAKLKELGENAAEESAVETAVEVTTPKATEEPAAKETAEAA